MALGYLDGMKAFGKKDGIWYTFEKGSIPAKAIRRADCAARVFELDPLKIYRRQSDSGLSNEDGSGSTTAQDQNDPTDIPVADLNEELASAVRIAEEQYLESKELLEKKSYKAPLRINNIRHRAYIAQLPFPAGAHSDHSA